MAHGATVDLVVLRPVEFKKHGLEYTPELAEQDALRVFGIMIGKTHGEDRTAAFIRAFLERLEAQAA